jgi:hypothetical protein
MFSPKRQRLLAVLFLSSCGITGSSAFAASCTTQSQMTAAQRDSLVSATKEMLTEMQSGNVQALQANTLPGVAADFSGISASVQNLKPLIQNATLTVNNLFLLDASTQTASTPIEFFCGQPVVTVNFSDLPAGTYALAVARATGVSQPQQMAFILAKSSQGKWLLGGLFIKPMVFEGHDGIWYWTSARKYAAQNGNWGAWFYYRIASNLLNPLDILSSPNLEKLQHESEKIEPANLPGTAPVSLSAHGTNYSLTAIDTTTAFGSLDLDVHYTPDSTQSAQLHDPPAARKQVMDIMATLLAEHPELHQAFHGMWVHADQGTVSLFALELPMDGIPSAMNGVQPTAR